MIYECYLNGQLYGSGSLEYMNELFKDYVVTMKMYGKARVTFEVVQKYDHSNTMEGLDEKTN